MAETTVTKDVATKTLIIERVFAAPRQRVWQAWTDGDMLAKWWGPRGWETTVKHFDFQPDGYCLYGMKCVDEKQGEWFGQVAWGKMTYLEVDEPSSFTYKDEFADAEGTPTPDMPVTTIKMEFVEEDGKTRVLSTCIFEDEEGYNKVLEMGMVEGVTQTWDRLDELVTEQE